jgi:prolyl-tRNA synthetase
VEIDDRDIGGARGWDWIKKGVPIRVEIGPRDIAANSVFFGRRDKAHRDKTSMPRDQFVAGIATILDDIQQSLYDRAAAYRKANTARIDTRSEFYDYFTPRNLKNPEMHGGFALSNWCGSAECEAKIKEDLSVTIRCLPLEAEKAEGPCICCGKPGIERAIFAKAY